MTGLKSRFLLAGLLASALMIGSAVTASADTIKIGVFGPLTGDAAATGAAEKEAVDLAIKEKNAAGGIRGKQDRGRLRRRRRQARRSCQRRQTVDRPR